MDEFWHDSPTFLNRGDKFMMGLTLMQLLMVGAIGGVWGLAGLIFEQVGLSTGLAWLCAGIGGAVTLAMALVRISGLRLVHYCVLLLVRWRNRPEFWIEGGNLDWDEDDEDEEAGVSRRFGLRRVPTRLTEQQASEARIAGHTMERGARDGYRNVRDGMKYAIISLIKGPAKG